jgi:EPS-associated MarR family transcriptional regulator
VLPDEVRYHLLRLLERAPEMSQREVARELGISLGKANYCLRSLVEWGWIKAANFKNSKNKAGYMYLLTPRGVEAKAKAATRFLQIKIQEYDELRVEISRIRTEVNRASEKS